MPFEDIKFKELTPMMQHWYSVKKKYPDTILAYRMGDFYEFFYDDAVRVSNLLGITLTKRKIGSDSYPLAGIPHHAGSYLNNLINLGETVVIVEQLEDPATVKGRIVKRGVVRILSPGTIIEPDMLKSNENNYICSIVKERKGFGIAFADLSTGEFVTTEFFKSEQDPLEKILSIFSQYNPVEVIVPTELKKDEHLFLLLTDLNDALIKSYEDYVFNYDEARDLIKRHFNISNLNSFDLENCEMAVQASGGLLAFLKETQRDVIPNLFKINLIREEKILHLDYITQRNLELEVSKFIDKINDFREARSVIEVSIKDDAPLTVKEGHLIKTGFNEKIDKLRDILQNGKKYVLDYEKQQRDRWKVNSGFKVGHNNILGYYIQITLKTLRAITKIPDEYIERQTLKNAKRYTTKELKELEEKIVQAEEQINDLEYEVFCIIREKIVRETLKILETAKKIAYIDVLACFAEVAEKYDYCRPKINKEGKIVIKGGRHPVVEQLRLSEKFIPNDCYLDTDDEQILMITGPNMAGKSTYLRQIALICIIAQMGCFVPAKSATIGVIDQVFTRIGASDDLARKLSTFMIEMTETAKILNFVTKKSLVIIDELGRGTSTSDGQSIALATLEKLHELKAKTLFSTHYHQLTEINLPRIKNYHLDIIENDDGSINFIRKLQPGSTDKSYGIHIAKLAGIPDDVIIRAFEILNQIEEKDPFKATVEENGNESSTNKYYDKFIQEKKKALERLNLDLDVKQREMNECEAELIKKERELGQKKFEVEKKKEQLTNLKDQSEITKKPGIKKKKVAVQTSFFKPIVLKERVVNENIEELIKKIEDIDINSMTPIDAMKKLIELKEKMRNIS